MRARVGFRAESEEIVEETAIAPLGYASTDVRAAEDEKFSLADLAQAVLRFALALLAIAAAFRVMFGA